MHDDLKLPPGRDGCTCSMACLTQHCCNATEMEIQGNSQVPRQTDLEEEASPGLPGPYNSAEPPACPLQFYARRERKFGRKPAGLCRGFNGLFFGPRLQHRPSLHHLIFSSPEGEEEEILISLSK